MSAASRFVSVVQRSGRRARVAVLACAAVLLVAGCSLVSLGYSNAAGLLAWRAGDWLALDDDQAVAVRAHLEAVHAWHRRSELPRMVAALRELQDRLGRPLELTDAEWLVAQAQAQYRALAARMIEESLPLLPELRPAQLARLERRFAERNREFAEKYIDAPAHEVRAARLERVEERLADWMGDLDVQQRRWLAARVEALPVDYPAVLADNQRRQRELLAILARAAGTSAPAAPADTRRALLRWATEWDHGRSPEYRAQIDLWLRGYERIVVEMFNAATPEQRDHARQRVRGYAQDLGAFLAPVSARAP